MKPFTSKIYLAVETPPTWSGSEYLQSTGHDWLVVTGDRQIHKNKAERQAFRQAKLKGFVFAAAYQKLPVNQQAALLLWRWPDVEALLALAPPFLFELPINRTSKIRVLPF